MRTENKTKDGWDKTDIIGRVIGSIAIPILIGFFGLMVNNRLTTETRDVDVVQRFSNIYYYEGNQDSRRLSIYYIRLIDNPQTRYELRQFVIWDALERNVVSGFNFDQELGDWHMLGDTIYDMAEDNPEQAKAYWCNLKLTTLKRWFLHEAELVKLYDWVESVYLIGDSDWANC